MTSVDYTKVSIKEKSFNIPPLREVVEVLSRGLADTFKSVSVSVVESPDLTQAPYNLTSPGLTGDVCMVELGGPSYLVPVVQRDKIYDLTSLMHHLKRSSASLLGAGAGPWPFLGVNCEGIINLTVRDGTVVSQGTRVVSVEPRGAAKGSSGYLQQVVPATETRIALFGNCLLSEGNPGKVIKVVAKNRTGDSNFITAIRETLKNHYGEQVIGLGGTFLLRKGKAQFHVMPDFSPSPLNMEDEDSWVHYFEMQAPIAHVGTMVTGDMDLDLREHHFHGFSAHGDGGHYEYDTTPETVEYEAYFTLASSVIRVDPPVLSGNTPFE